MADDVLTRNENDELAVRVVSTSGDTSTNPNDVYTRDENGKLCVRVTGGGDQHNLGYFATLQALQEAYPTAEAGDWAIVGATDTVWIWDTDTSAWKDSDQKGQVTSVNNQTGAVTLTAGDVGAATAAQGAKADTAVQPSDLATVATTGSYTDLTNTPTIPAAQVNSDWNSTSGVSEILNKPTLATVATTGAYSDLSGTPTIPEATQVSTMPTASADELGNIYQFVGTTDANYTNGYFYKCVSDGENPATYSWERVDVQPSSSPIIPSTMPTLAVADWSNNTQTVNVTGVTATNVVFVSPAPASAADYASAGIVCTAQGAGTLTFTCTTTPTNAITVNVVCL